MSAVSGIQLTAKGMLAKGAPGALANNNPHVSVEIIATPSANVNPSGHTTAQTSGQSAHTPP